MHHKLTLFAAAVAVTFAAAAPTLAQDMSAERQTRIVGYDDLDLSNQRGRERLETRIRSAANAACGYWSARTLTEKRVAHTCRSTAIAKAQPEIAAAVRNAAARYAGRSAE